jgi:hypothetical protein
MTARPRDRTLASTKQNGKRLEVPEEVTLETWMKFLDLEKMNFWFIMG